VRAYLKNKTQTKVLGCGSSGRVLADHVQGLWFNPNCHSKKQKKRYQWLMHIILGTQEAEIRRIAVRNQPRQIVPKALSQKNPL
jgi:hypothetical protein